MLGRVEALHLVVGQPEVMVEQDDAEESIPSMVSHCARLPYC
jgi:hypothetical protein